MTREVSADNRQPLFRGSTRYRPEAKADGEQRKDERRRHSGSAGQRTHEDHARCKARGDHDDLRRSQRTDQPAPLERPKPILAMLACAHASPASGGGSLMRRVVSSGGRGAGGGGGVAV